MSNQDKPASAIPIEAIASYPLPGTVVPGDITWSPDDKLITYLLSPDLSLTRQLYAFDPETGTQHVLVTPPDGGVSEDHLSLEERLQRERQRQRALGVTQYAWAQRTQRLLIPLHSGIYIQDGIGAPLRLVVAGKPTPALDAQLSPDGEWIAYVQDAELYVVPAAGGEPRQLTHGARGTGRTHGLAEYIAQEEMDRSEGFWWSPDSRTLAFTEVDETHIPPYTIVHQGNDATGPEAQEVHRYPFAGAENARVRLATISLEGEMVWMDLGEDDQYLARVDWLPDGTLTAQIENRTQTSLELVRFDQHGNRTRLLRETSDIWINLHDLFRPLTDGRFIWASERTGFRHLYLYSGDGGLIRPLTEGERMVDAVVTVDEDSERLYFTGTRETATESHLYSVSLAGGAIQRLTLEPGIHRVIVDHSKRRFVDVYDARDTPPTVTLRSLTDGTVLRTIFDAPDPRLEKLHLDPPELVTLTTREGTTLHGALYRPPTEFGDGPFPTIVSVYGGPHAQLVTNSWAATIAMRAQYLRGLGFLVFTLDNRGSARRGLAFEGAIKHDMGHYEVDDQVDGIHWLVERGLTDPQRVGIYGWSYGGYMSAMCILRAPETFKVAVAGAPVTRWDGYDTHYTERYMGTPQQQPIAYEDTSVLRYVDNLTGKLMLVHGLIDENVHFRHTARLINALIQARKPYDLRLFPNERHMPRGMADRIFLEEQIRDYFLQNL